MSKLDTSAKTLIALAGITSGLQQPAAAVLSYGILDANDDQPAFYVRGNAVYNRLGTLILDLASAATGGTTSYTITGAEAGDASLILAADEADDTADTYTIQSKASDNTLNFINGVTTVATLTSAGTITFAGGVKSTSPSVGIGYATGAGVAATQGTSVTTTVAANGICGTITTFSQTAAAGVDVSFTFTNTAIAANDVVVVSTKSYGGTADGIPVASVQATAAGSCIINIRNTGAITLDALVVLNFAVIKAVAA